MILRIDDVIMGRQEKQMMRQGPGSGMDGMM